MKTQDMRVLPVRSAMCRGLLRGLMAGLATFGLAQNLRADSPPALYFDGLLISLSGGSGGGAKYDYDGDNNVVETTDVGVSVYGSGESWSIGASATYYDSLDNEISSSSGYFTYDSEYGLLQYGTTNDPSMTGITVYLANTDGTQWVSYTSGPAMGPASIEVETGDGFVTLTYDHTDNPNSMGGRIDTYLSDDESISVQIHGYSTFTEGTYGDDLTYGYTISSSDYSVSGSGYYDKTNGGFNITSGATIERP